MAMCAGAQELLYLTQFLSELEVPQLTPPAGMTMQMRGDNQSALKMAMEGSDNSRSKHINIRYHFLKDLVEQRVLEVQYVPTAENIADILTKPLQRIKHNLNCRRLSLQPSG